MKHLSAFLIAALLCQDTAAQITPIGTVNSYQGWMARMVRSLASAGTKFMVTEPTGLLLYDLDGTPFQTVTFPAPPVGFTWVWQYPSFISEDVFDSDPSTLEYLIAAEGSGMNGTAVLRDDGTILFWVPGEQMMGISSSDDLNSAPSVFNTPNGAVMRLLDTTMVTHVYQLPGMLPCIACDGSLTSGMAMGELQGGPTPSDGMSLFPNPSADRSEVIFGLPEGTTARTVVLLDMAGQVVKRIAVPQGADRMTITIADVSSGTYSFQLETDAGMVAGKRLVVVR